MELRGKVALVTGGARRLGRAIALELAARGADIVVHYGHAEADADATATAISSLGVAAVPVCADLADPAAIDALFAEVERRFGRLDVLVNSAATFRRRPLGEVELEEWDAVMAVNLRAPFLCVQRAAPLMRVGRRPAGEAGAVINLVDGSAVRPWPGYVHHGVSKAGLLHLTRIAARELAPDVRVNAVLPGAVLPPDHVSVESDAWRRLSASVPLGRAGTPGDVARAVAFLAEADYVTGVVVPVDGGQQLVGPMPL